MVEISGYKRGDMFVKVHFGISEELICRCCSPSSLSSPWGSGLNHGRCCGMLARRTFVSENCRLVDLIFRSKAFWVGFGRVNEYITVKMNTS